MRLKAFFTPLIFLICSLSLLQAQVPQTIPYQAVARMNGSILTNQTMDFRLTILQGGATIVYQEVQTSTSNAYGVLTFNIGGGNVILGQLSTIDWQTGDYNLKVEVDNNGGWVNMGTTQMRSVPYSLYANRAVRADSVELSIGELMDVVAPAPGDGEILKYDSVSGFWIPSPDMGGGANFVAGDGISISGDTIINTGDLNPNDVQIGDTASGDLGQFYPNPEVWGLAGNPIATSAINPPDGHVLKWSSTLGQWVPQADATVSNPGATTNTSSPLIGDGSSVAPVTLGQNGASTGQVLKWNGVFWEALNDSTNEYILDLNGDILSMLQLPDSSLVNSVQIPGANLVSGDGILISGSIISNIGDIDSTNDITTSTIAGGDLDGPYPDPSVVGIQGIPVAPNTTLQGNDIMKFIGGQWTYVPDETMDDDADPFNEFQILTVDPINWTASIAPNGNTVSLPQYVQGPGISIDPSGWILSNTGDLDPSNDVTIGSAAGGDLTGSYPNPVVRGIHGFPITPLPPGNGQIYTFDSTVPGWVLNNVDTDSTNDVTIGSSAGGDLEDTYPNPRVAGIQGNPVSPIGPSANQILKYNGAQWVPAPDLIDDADSNPSNEIQTLSASGNQLTLTSSGSITMYTPGTGISVVGNQISIDGSVLTSSTAAGGDLDGTYPNPQVVGLNGDPISNLNPQNGQILKFSNGQWIPSTDLFQDGDNDQNNEIQILSQIGNQLNLTNGGGSTTLFVAGQGISLTGSGNTINNTGDLDPSNDVEMGDPAGGDLNGTYPDPGVARIQGELISTQTPIANQVLKYIGGQWTPADDIFQDGDISSTNELQDISQIGNQLSLSNGSTVTLFTEGAGIDIIGNQIVNTGDTLASDDLNIGAAAGGDLDGTYPNPTVAGIMDFPIVNINPTDGQMYKYLNGQWIASNDLIFDGDSSATNEIQDISQSGNQLSLTSGSTVTLFTAGAGISLSGNQIINTGDPIETDDLNIGDAAGGDLSGTYPNPSVAGIMDFPIVNITPTNGQVYKFLNNQWIASNDLIFDGDSSATNELQDISQSGNQLSLTGGSTVTLFTAGAGISLSGNQIINTGDPIETDDINIGDIASGDLGGTYPSPTVAAIQGVDVSTTSPTTGQILKFIGGQWIPAVDQFEDGDTEDTNELQSLSINGDSLSLSLGGGAVQLPIYVEGSGIDIINNVVINTGDTLATDDITDSTPAGGDLGGIYPAPSVIRIQGRNVSSSTPISGEVLKWNGSEWEPAADSGSTYVPGAGIGIAGNVITNTGDLNGNDDITTSTPPGGDLSGSYPAPTVSGLQGRTISSSTPTTGEVLKWTGTEWEPAIDSTTTYLGGNGISIAGSLITNTGDLDGTDDITTATASGGDLNGLYPNPTVIALQGRDVSTAAPSNGEVLKWTGTEWEPAADSGTTYTPGIGINIVGDQISNTGDTDETDDITTSTTAAGDLNGLYPAPTVIALQGRNISTAAPNTSEVLKWTGTEWEPAIDSTTTYTGGAGINVVGSQITNTGDLDPTNDITTTTSAAGDLNGLYPAPTVIALQGRDLSSAAPNTGEVLKWTGTEWEPAADSGSTYTPGAGINIVGNQITNTGDLDGTDDITTATSASGDLNGLYPAPTVIALQGRNISTAVPNTGEILKWTGTEWEPTVDSTTTYTGGAGINVVGSQINNTGDLDPTNDITTSTAAAGDLNGLYPAPTVIALQGRDVSNAAPNAGEILKWTGTEWEPAADSGSTYSPGAGISIIGDQISNTGDLDGSDDITTATNAAGDLNGLYPAPTVIALQGRTISSSAPSTGEILKWTGTEWEPTIDSTTTYTGGAGINVVGSQINNTGDLDPTNDITTSTAAAGDLNGLYPAPTVIALQGRDLSSAAPNTGEVLKWTGTEWEPAADSGTVYTAGLGISIVGDQISNTGDSDASDDITTSTTAAGDLNGLYPAPTVIALQGRSVSSSAPSTGEILKWTGTEWEPAVDSTTTYIGGAGINIVGNQINNTGDPDPADDITTSTAAAGDLNGLYPAPTVIALQGQDVSNAVPSTGEVLKWTGTEWEAAADSGSTYTPGAGISIIGDQISNTGDLDGSDDITTATNAAGDLNGLYPAPTVIALQGRSVSSSAPSTGEILKWTGTEWEPAIDSTTTYVGGTGINVVGNQINNTGDPDPADDITTSTTAAGDLNGLYPAPTVIALQGRDISTAAPSTGEVLKWTGTEWEPAIDSTTTYIGGAGINIVGNQINNTGDPDPADDITTSTAAAGDLNGLYPAPTVIALQGRDVSNAAPSTGEVLKWTGTEWEPAIDSTTTYIGGAGINIVGNQINNTGDPDPADDITTSTAAAGDLNGLYPAPTVIALQGRDVSTAAPSTGEVLKWTGTEWEPALDSTTTYTGGTGISIVGDQISNTGDTDSSDDITTATSAAGDLNGLYPAPTVIALQGRTVSSSAPATGEILKWTGTEWEPAADSGTVYTAGAGITIVGDQISNIGDLDASDDITTTTTAGGDLNGLYPDPTVVALQGRSLSNATPNTGEILKWAGTEWEPAIDSTTTYTAGSGINIVGSQINNTGDPDATDDITIATTAGGDLNGLYPDPTVVALQGRTISTATPTTGEVMTWSGTEWEPDSVDVDDADADPNNEIQTLSVSGLALSISGGNSVNIPPYVGGNGISISGLTIDNTGDTDDTDDITNTTAAGGDLTGIYPNPDVVGLQGNPVAAGIPTLSEVLKWTGTTWEASADSVNDADADPTNELQGLSLIGNQLSLSGSSDTITLGTVGSVYAAGPGIDIDGSNIVSNTGDRDSTDDITNTTVAGGDLTGIYPNPTVAQIQNNPVVAGIPSTDDVLKWDGTQWNFDSDTDSDSTNEIQSLSLSGITLSISDGNSVNLPYIGGAGIALSGATIINVGDTDAANDITNTTAAGGDLSGIYPNPTVVAIQGNDIANVLPATGEVLKWNGTQWEPLPDSGSTYSPGPGISISGATISNIGDTDDSDDITIGSTADGDLNGTYPNPTVDGIQGRAISNATPSNLDILKWNAGANEWVPNSDSVNIYTGGTGINVSGLTITNTGDNDDSDDITIGSAADGDLDGTYPNPSVDGLRGRTISATAPSDLDILKWDATANEWTPTEDSVNIYSAGTGMEVNGLTITNIGDTDSTNDVTIGSVADGDLDGTYPNPTVDGLRGRAISATAPSDMDILKWDATANEWTPDLDSVNVYTAGTGMEVNGLTITNIGDTDSTNDVTIGSAADGDLAGTYPNPTVDGLQGVAVASATPDDAEFLRYDGTSWTPDSLRTADLLADSSILPAIDNSIDLGSNAQAWRDVYSFNAVTVTSDRREKEEIAPLSYGLEHILKLNPVSYTWKRFPQQGRQLGLIAQEVAPVIEEVISVHGKDGMRKVSDQERLGITYGELIPVIIKGMQEQQEMVEQQQEVISKQQALIDALEARLQSLENSNK